MKNIKPFSLAFFVSLISLCLAAQSPYQFHSHNDYKQDFPFWKAYIHQAASIEIDILLKNGKLYVAHQEDEIQEEKTLEKLYLKPLSELAQESKLRKLQLLIDVKTEAKPSLDRLLEILRDYPELTNSNKLSVVISGNRPAIEEYQKYPEFIKFDHQNLNNLEQVDLSKIALISLNFKDYSVWNGLGRITTGELKKIEKLIKKAEMVDKPIRFWGSPDTKTTWSRFATMGVDFINTDYPAQASYYLNNLEKNTIITPTSIPVYQPEFPGDFTEKPKNIILMIGDGNGLNQISSGMIANKGELTLTQLKDLGLIKTSSFDDLVTDSAAGGTAIATGKKTNNRAIGTGPNGEILKNLPEILAGNGFLKGIITDDNITGATPSSFYAHVKERDNSHAILKDLRESKIDFFISNGPDDFPVIQDEFVQKRISDFNDFEESTAIYLSETSGKSTSKHEFYFYEYVEKALLNLEAQDKPYFLMIEGAKIDSNGHTNNAKGIVQKVLDFDRTVAEALKVADQNKNTLVVITADHDTSGFGIMQGDLKKGKIEGGFLTKDHTATMVPIFAYGPKSQNFTGVYENHLIFNKILEALELKQ